ncbi:hypothetical protein ACFFMR_22665 [Micromonospora andamanensis]|uniref:CdiI C-terminal domain-containing protein n=1 Tax=Micromonospora andamanensis TaxID=1287068 RepID=A0ABQ4HXV0_9ACTN|nr:hypothetical protein [Micromonospora andamanensis]GIJ10445.1 hypothetical protein Van01_36590 [Micromonospora andamanensis]
MFRIELSGPGGRALDPSVSVGKISAGDLDETFEMPTQFWSEASYRASWRRELQRILDGADRAVLLTLVVDPRSANWLRGYALYRLDSEIRIQERLFFLSELGHEFDLANPSRSVPAHASVTDDGLRISEWTVTIAELRGFFEDECNGSEG